MDFKTKYKDVILSISKANNVDVDVAFAMLVSSVKGHFHICYNAAGIFSEYEKYPGIPEKFDYNEAINDYMGSVGLF